MASKLTDSQLTSIYGRRITNAVSLFEPYELGYRCPRGHRGVCITWSEFKDHIWCYRCKLDYLSGICPIQRPSWQSVKDFKSSLSKLPFKTRIIRGVDWGLEEIEKEVDNS